MLKEQFDQHAGWLALWFILIAAALYSRPPIPIDETRYLSVAWEMWQNGDFLVPHINGEPYSHKPPLLFWLINLVWKVFGVSELSARVVAPCFGLISVFLTIRLARMLWPRIPQLSATVPYLMLGTLLWSVYSSLTMFDTLLTTFVLLCLNSIYSASLKRSAATNWLVTGVLLGLGVIAKGPVVFLYVLPAIIFAPFWIRSDSVSWVHWYLGAIVSCMLGIGVALSWALPAAAAGGEEYANAILLHQTVGRVVHSFAHNRPFYWYLAILPLLFFPWFFWLPSWISVRRQWLEPGTRFCLISAAAILILLSCISGKQIHYVLPMMPIVILLIARNFVNFQESITIDRFPIFIILISIGIGLLLLPLFPLKGGDREILTKLPAWLAVIPIASAIPLLFSKRSATEGIRLVSLCMAGLFVALHISLQEPLHKTFSQDDVGVFLEQLQEETDAIAVFPSKLSDQFQFDGKLKQTLYPAESFRDLEKWAEGHPTGYSLLYLHDQKDMATLPARIITEYKSGWILVASNNDLIRRQ